MHSGWLTAALPSSAAIWAGNRRVMTEVSDFSEKMSGRGPADLAAMQAAAAWQAAWGVTDFTLYYGIQDRSAEDYRAVLPVRRPAELDPQTGQLRPSRAVVLSDPRPVAGISARGRAAERAVAVAESSDDHQLVHAVGTVAPAEPDPVRAGRSPTAGHGAHDAGRPNGAAPGEQRFTAILCPQGAQLPLDAAALARFRSQGGLVLVDQPDEPISRESLLDALKPPYRFSPASDRIALGQFRREGQQVLLVVNVGREPYEGKLIAEQPGSWCVLDPASGMKRRRPDERGQYHSAFPEGIPGKHSCRDEVTVALGSASNHFPLHLRTFQPDLAVGMHDLKPRYSSFNPEPTATAHRRQMWIKSVPSRTVAAGSRPNDLDMSTCSRGRTVAVGSGLNDTCAREGLRRRTCADRARSARRVADRGQVSARGRMLSHRVGHIA